MGVIRALRQWKRYWDDSMELAMRGGDQSRARRAAREQDAGPSAHLLLMGEVDAGQLNRDRLRREDAKRRAAAGTRNTDPLGGPPPW